MEENLYPTTTFLLVGGRRILIKYFPILVLVCLETFLIIQQRDLFYHAVILLGLLIKLFIVTMISSSSSTVYLVDFSCLEPPSSCRVPLSTFLEHVQMLDFLDKESVSFMNKVLTNSGQGERTCLPPAVHYIPPRSDHQEAIEEVHMVLFLVFEQLLSKTNTSPSDIDILIVNCSGFSPSPSLSSIIVNKYSLREDVKTFNLTGMGCSASALAVDLANNILKKSKINNNNAVILSTEILSTGWYPGKNQSMMILNCLFRMGAAGILLTNDKTRFKKNSKYKLLCCQRTQRAFDDKGYYSAIREEDSDGLTGFTLRRDQLLQVAGETLRSNITILGGKILPITEQLFYVASILWKKLMVDNKCKDIYYVPNFKKVVQHFCLPTSGKGVIREIGKVLKLEERDMEAALMTLHRFGNQSSSSVWYELGYLEGKERVKVGDKVWQLGMGTGPKCSSLVWECINTISGEAQKGPWADTIHTYPISVSCN